MKRSVQLAVLFLVGCATGGVASRIAIPPARAGTSVQQWEYTCLKNADTSTMNSAGREGWEMLSSMPVQGAGGITNDFWYCFKRPR